MARTAATRYPDALPGTWLAARLSVDPARIEALRRAGELLAVREPGSLEWRYPAWQFDGAGPRSGVARVVAAARDVRMDEARLYELLTAPLGLSGRDRRRLVDLLREGREDEVVAAVRAAA